MISSQDGKAVNILEECNRDVWEASEGASKKDAWVVIDMKCSLKLQEIQLIHGGGEFSTKGFSVFGSDNSTGPLIRLFMGEVERVKVEIDCFYMIQQVWIVLCLEWMLHKQTNFRGLSSTKFHHN